MRKFTFAKAWIKIWSTAVILIGLGLYIFGYHYPMKMNSDTKEKILTILDKDTTITDTIIVSSIEISKTVGLITTTKVVEGKETKTTEDVQEIKFLTIDSCGIKTNQEGLIILDPKILGYNIKEIRLKKHS